MRSAALISRLTKATRLRTTFARLASEGNARSQRLARIRSALERFPALADHDQKLLFWKIVLSNFNTALTFRIVASIPRTARRIGRLIPIVGDVAAIAAVPNDRPVILAGRHFGSTHFVSTVISRLFEGRNVYVLHASGEQEHMSARYIRSSGNIPVETGRSVLQKLSDIMVDDPSCVLWLAFDNVGDRGRRGRRMDLTFLGTWVSVPMGLAHLARIHRAPAISIGWEFLLRGPRVRVGNVYHADQFLEPAACEEDLTRRLFAELEEQILRTPHEWTQWWNCFPVAG